MFESGLDKSKLLEKILELFSQLPDSEDAQAEVKPEDAKVEVLSVDAKPMAHKEIC